RSTRLRWLAAGERAPWRWDAFVAPTGARLTALMAAHPLLSWTEARHLLEQLTAELEASGADGTRPATLTVEQVWVQPNGSTQLLDSLPGPAAAADNGPEPALSLLCQVAALTLEGRVPASGGREPPVTAPQQGAHAPRSPDTAQPIRAVTPLHARDML